MATVLGDLEHHPAGLDRPFGQQLGDEIGEPRVLQTGAGQVDGARAQRAPARVQAVDVGERGLHHPAIDQRHQAVAFPRQGGRRRAHLAPVLAAQPEQQFHVHPGLAAGLQRMQFPR